MRFLPVLTLLCFCGLAGASPLRDKNPETRWRAAYALSRSSDILAAAELAAGTKDENLWVRAFSLRALGKLKNQAPLEPLVSALADPEYLVRLEAVRALGLAGKADLLGSEIFRDPSAHVRAAAAAALAATGHPALAEKIAPLAGETSTLVRGEVVLAYPKILNPQDALKILSQERTFPHWWIKSRALVSLGSVPGGFALLKESLQDPDPRLAAAALEGLAKSTDTAVDAILESVLNNPKSVLELREAAAEAAEGRPSPSLQAALAQEKERVKKSIAKLYSYSGRAPAPAAVVLETDKGEIEIALAALEAPIHSESFLKNAAAGFYDGTIWHRVVSGFVIQGGDPRGSGSGDGGFSLRDEISALPFERGTVGMAKADKDTGSCQLFIMHAPAPHLDGRYTVFGRVTRGMDVVDAIEPGDKILRARVIRDAGRKK